MIDKNKNPNLLESLIIDILKTVFDPEILVNIYDLGLIYEIEIDNENNVDLKMTLTAPGCPMAEDILAEVYQKIGGMQEVKRVTVDLVFDPPWDKDMMNDEALLELGML